MHARLCLSCRDRSQITPVFCVFALAFVSLLFGSAHAASERPSPLSVPVGTEWVGYDGNWSPVQLRVGSPPQWLNVIPNTRSSETWVIGRDGCDSTMTCRVERGGLFLSNESSTWSEVGPYEIGYTVQLENEGVASYGYDDIALNDDLTLTSQVVGVVNTTDWWIGTFGLGIKRSNFVDANKLSFLSSLKESGNHIPSHSYGYTAGAYNRLKGVPASLTFGGVDRNRFVPNDVSFDLSPDNLPVIGIQSIDMSMNLIDSPMISDGPGLVPSENDYLFTIDSSTPFFWFPEDMCDAFADALALTYNDTLQLYTYKNESRYDYLADYDLKLTFTLSNLPNSSTSVDIELPVSSLDHRLSFPFPQVASGPDDEGVRYFPLRKANDSSQYTIGRTLLQDAYLTVDYERKNFSISQAEFPRDALTETDIVEISPTGEESSDTDNPLSTAAKAGAGVGVSVFVILAALAVFFCLRRRKKVATKDEKQEEKQSPKRRGWKFWRKPTTGVVPTELPADRRYPTEAPADASATRFELPAECPAELPASELGHSCSGSNELKENEAYQLPAYNCLPPTMEDSNNFHADEVRLPPYRVVQTRRIDTGVDDSGSVFPSPIQGNLTSEGSHSIGVSPLTAYGEHSSSDSFLQASQTSSSRPLVLQSASPGRSPTGEGYSRRSTSRFVEDFGIHGNSPQDQPTSSPQVRRKFSWEE